MALKSRRASSGPPDVQEYLSKHGIEGMLANAMQQLLRDRPEDPKSYIASLLGAGAPSSFVEGNASSSNANPTVEDASVNPSVEDASSPPNTNSGEALSLPGQVWRVLTPTPMTYLPKELLRNSRRPREAILRP